MDKVCNKECIDEHPRQTFLYFDYVAFLCMDG